MALNHKIQTLNNIWLDKSHGAATNADNRVGLWETHFSGFKVAMDSLVLVGHWLIWPSSDLSHAQCQAVVAASHDQYYYVMVKVDPYAQPYRKGAVFPITGGLYAEDLHQVVHILELVEEARQAAHRWMVGQL